MKPFTLPTDGAAPRSRPDQVRKSLLRSNRKLESRFRKAKFDRMARSASDLFRGSCALFWADLAESPLLEDFGGRKDTRLWTSADAHHGNFGSFNDATGRLVYDLNDLDEAVIADYQLDLWRLAVSLVLSLRENGKNPKKAESAAVECARGYWRELKSCRWYPTVRHSPWDEEQAAGSLRHFLARVRKDHGYPALLQRWTLTGKAGPRFKTGDNRDLETIPTDLRKKLERSLQDHAKGLKPWPGGKPRVFEVEDLARRLNAGLGSEGHRRFWALVRVKDEGAEPYRILDIKEEVEPSAWEHLPKKARRKTRELFGDNQALRVELAWKALGRHPDPWLGRLGMKGSDYLVQERSPYKDSLPPSSLDEETSSQLGAILARAHCRAKDSFAAKAFERIRKDKKAFRKGVGRIASAYADQVEMDFQAFKSLTPEG